MMLYNTEVLIAFNTNGVESRGAEVTVDASLHPEGSTMTYLYQSDWSDDQLRNPPENQTVVVKHYPDGRASVRIDLPPSEMAIFG